ncbi:UNVERIFIED_CONTAM: Retrovirus-related Pol polyprotein from transposon TNT 1-94, partial [Sesamum angustifolium]
MKRLVDSKSLEIDNLDNLPACESYLKGKMTKKPFVGQSKLANGLLDLIHTDVCGPLNTQARDYLKDNGIVSQWTPPGTPQLNGVVERRNPTLLDMIRSMMSFTELPLSFWGYALETAARLLNIAPSKTVAQKPYQIWHGKPATMFLERGFPTNTRRDELLLEESSEAPQSNAGTSSTPDVSTGNVPILRKSARVPQPLERYGFLGVTGQLDNDPKTYGEAMSDMDSRKWLEAMKSEMDSMSSNQVWTLVDRPKALDPLGCKWVYKRKIGADGEMDVKTAFLNGFVEEEIYMDQPEQKVRRAEGLPSPKIHLWLKARFLSWNIRFDEVIWGYDFVKNDFDPYVYKKVSGSSVLFLVLYVDDILLIGNDIKMLGDTKAWLSTQFSMEDL